MTDRAGDFAGQGSAVSKSVLMNRTFLFGALPGLLIMCGAICCDPGTPSGAGDLDAAPKGETDQNQSNQQEKKKMEEVAVITTPHGEIVVRFFPELAPKHVESFKKLVREGFYDGTAFHRVIPGFMIQGGDPNSKDPNNRAAHGTGGPGYSIPAEFSDRKHTRGILSAARSQNPNSAGSQFFLCVADSPWLDNQYSIFGEVVSGMEVADKIVAEERDARDNPLKRMEVKMVLAER